MSEPILNQVKADVALKTNPDWRCLHHIWLLDSARQRSPSWCWCLAFSLVKLFAAKYWQLQKHLPLIIGYDLSIGRALAYSFLDCVWVGAYSSRPLSFFLERSAIRWYWAVLKVKETWNMLNNKVKEEHKCESGRIFAVIYGNYGQRS